MKQNIIVSSGMVALFMAVVAGILWYKNNYPAVGSFAECKKAGYQILEGNPRICKAGIKNFAEQD